MSLKDHGEFIWYKSLIKDTKGLTKLITLVKVKCFLMSFHIGTNKQVEEEDLTGLYIDLTEQGIQFELKLFQAKKGENSILTPMFLSHIPEEYLNNPV